MLRDRRCKCSPLDTWALIIGRLGCQSFAIIRNRVTISVPTPRLVSLNPTVHHN